VVDIAELNAELKITVAKIDQLRKDIDAIVAEIDLPAGRQEAY
jgi:type I restriction enzyme M protein